MIPSDIHPYRSYRDQTCPYPHFVSMGLIHPNKTCDELLLSMAVGIWKIRVPVAAFQNVTNLPTWNWHGDF